MNPTIEKELNKIITVAKSLENENLRKNVDFLLTATDEQKVNFINNEENYFKKDNLTVIVDMSIFDNSDKVKIAIGKNANLIADSCVDLINQDARRHINVVVDIAKNAYEKDLKLAKQLEKKVIKKKRENNRY